MSTTAAYTPLECLLLFQSLVALGTDDEDFVHISELLKKSPMIREGPSYDPQRLEATALRELYLKLVRDDLRPEEQDETEENNQPHSRKRKIPSPTLSSPLYSSRINKHKLPLLVDRLYAKYRDYMIRAIEDDERKYAALQGQIQQIERGDWDERILHGGELDLENILAASAKKNGIAAESLKSTIELDGSKKLEQCVPNSTSPNSSMISESRQDGLEVSPARNRQEAHTMLSPRNDDARPGLQNILPRIKNGTSRPPKQSPPQITPKAVGEQKSEPKNRPRSKSPLNRHGKPLQAKSPLQNHARSSPGSPSSSARSKPQLSFSSPLVLPPSHGVLLPPSMGIRSPGMPLDALADAAGQQHRAPSKPTSQPTHQHHSQENSNGKILAQNGSYQQDMKSTKTQKPQTVVNDVKQKQHASPHSLIQTEVKKYSSPYNSSHGLRTSIPSHLLTLDPNIKSSQSCPNLLDTPTLFRSRKLVTGRGTSWTPKPLGSTPRDLITRAPPPIEPLSPVHKKIASDKPVSDKTQNQHKTPSTEIILNLERSKPDLCTPTTASLRKSKSLTSDGGKGVLDRHTGDHSVDEKVATPRNPEDVEHPKSSCPSPLKSEKLGPSLRLKIERKQIILENNEPRPPSTILWTRAFPRISAQALQDILTDKNASMFSNPIKDKDAPGYRTIILRPQDLKSIRSAITAGHRAATAAAPEGLDPNATSVWLPISEDLIPPKGIINYAQLEKELMRMFANAIMFNPDPKRGLGPAWHDAVQRSKEEALGYAFDEDSVVKGTRDMFAAVEKKVSDLRSVERRSKEARETKTLKLQAENQEDDSEVNEEIYAGGSGTVVKKRRKA